MSPPKTGELTGPRIGWWPLAAALLLVGASQFLYAVIVTAEFSGASPSAEEHQLASIPLFAFAALEGVAASMARSGPRRLLLAFTIPGVLALLAGAVIYAGGSGTRAASGADWGTAIFLAGMDLFIAVCVMVMMRDRPSGQSRRDQQTA